MAKKDIKFLQKEELRDEMRYPVGRYLPQNLERIDFMGQFILEELKGYDRLKVVNLICRGSSGAIVAALILQKLVANDVDCKISHIKKKGESSHSSSFSMYKEEVNIIVDDFVSSGETMRNIYSELVKAYEFNEPPVIDMLAVTGTFDSDSLNFQPKILISGGAY